MKYLDRRFKMDKIKKHNEICNKLNQIYDSKNHDYGDSFSETFSKLGIVSAVTRITDKVNRLQNLTTKEQRVGDETINDTLMDLANYSIMTLIELEDKGKSIKVSDEDVAIRILDVVLDELEIEFPAENKRSNAIGFIEEILGDENIKK